jgi:protein-S-isoprenylcysteine O-methyltransferase Ste14
MSASSPATAAGIEHRVAWRGMREVAFNVLLSLLFLQFAMGNLSSLLDGFRLSTLLVLLKVSTDVVFYLIRRIPKDVSVSVYDWFIALTGTYAIVFFRPFEEGHDLLIGQVLQSGGMALQIAAMLSLNRSIGMVPANRGVKTGGLYRYVRHPLYLSYVIAYLGYVISHPSAFNVGVYSAAVLLWVLRLLAEERFLLGDAVYRSYAEKVRFRLLPGVF